VLVVAAAGCVACSHHVSVDERIVPARPVALDACRQWDAVTARRLPGSQEAAALGAVVGRADDATNQNLIYVQLRFHMEAVVRAQEQGDAPATRKAKRVVDDDCQRIRRGRPPTGLTGG